MESLLSVWMADATAQAPYRTSLHSWQARRSDAEKPRIKEALCNRRFTKVEERLLHLSISILPSVGLLQLLLLQRVEQIDVSPVNLPMGGFCGRKEGIDLNKTRLRFLQHSVQFFYPS